MNVASLLCIDRRRSHHNYERDWSTRSQQAIQRRNYRYVQADTHVRSTNLRTSQVELLRAELDDHSAKYAEYFSPEFIRSFCSHIELEDDLQFFTGVHDHIIQFVGGVYIPLMHRYGIKTPLPVEIQVRTRVILC